MEYTPQLSVEFKNIVAKYSSQFRGNSQQDALEFLLWLLDRMHEDLNSSSRQKAKPPEHSGSPPASPTDSGHSFVRDHFQAQYRSSLTCPHCHKQSDTFDPFLCVSLPIPLRQTRALSVTLAFQAKQRRFLRVGVAVPLFGTVAALRQMVADEGRIPPEQVILAELFSSGFQRSFWDDEDLNAIADGDPVYAFQAPPPLAKASGRSSEFPHSLPASPRGSDPTRKLSRGGSVSSDFLAAGSRLLLLLCNVDGAGSQAVRFGPPLVIREECAVSWDHLQQSILGNMRYLMRSDAPPPVEAIVFQLRVVGAPPANCYLSAKDARPLQHPAIDRALQLCGSGGPPHVKLVVEWDPKTKERMFGSIQEEVVQDDESVRTQQLDHQQQSCSLAECFQLYTKEEQLALDDAWRCPHCKVLQQGTVKLSLWTLPDILIVHLKRFRQVGGRRNKLSTLVRFPLAGLDMAPHVVKRSQSGGRSPVGQWSSWKPPPYRPVDNGPLDVLYDLYAVCNHHGSLQGGHYTAFCRNSVDARWYSYDDSNVEQIPQDDVCTRGAYLLFYQKRTAIPTWSASSSVRGSTSSSVSDHWVLRLNGKNRESVGSRAPANCAPLPADPDTLVFLDEDGSDQGCGTRAFVRGVKGRSASLRIPSRLKRTLSKAMPLRWSFGPKDRTKPKPGDLGEFPESGRQAKGANDDDASANQDKLPNGAPPTQSANESCSASGQRRPADAAEGKPKVTRQDSAGAKGKDLPSQSKLRTLGAERPTSSVDTRERFKASPSSGKHREANQRTLTKDGAPDAGPHEGKSKPRNGALTKDGTSESKPRIGAPKKEARRPSGSDSIKSEVSNGTAKASVSNGVLPDERTSGTVPRPQKEGELPAGKPQLDIRRVQSSSNVQTKAEWTMKRSASLYRNGSAPHHPRGYPGDNPALQRMKLQTSSLGRKKSVPESSF
ncbi:ubiquitin carboxyl-terminal hydrolase 43 [Gastrophryne carolinensis]